ncbi:MAG: CRISPR-associated protein [Candidatus Nitrosocaldaceae archaeon]|nr:MAG: CRISPR-associated protein [Candidatus Nitrosocaldaceae archaeon]
MIMRYDFISEYYIKEIKDIYELTSGQNRYLEIEDIYNRIILLISAVSQKDLKIYAQTGVTKRKSELKGKGGIKLLLHDKAEYNNYIKSQCQIMKTLNINTNIDNIDILPKSSFYINIKFTLKTPYISNDDVPFYIIDNPIKKEHIFKIPMVTASSWKGNLRWTMMKQLEMDSLNDKEFAERRFRLSLLFGTEKGIDENKGFAEYMKMLRPSADIIYKNKLKEYFNTTYTRFEGRLRFYPTYFDKIDLMIINPHDRVTKTGIKPIYIECVPERAKGEFSLLYIPIDLIGRDVKMEEEIEKDLKLVSEGIRDMLCKYGFSAKKSSGFGIVEKIENNDIVVKPENLKCKVTKILSDNNEQYRT